MGRIVQTNSKTKVNNYRIEKYKTDKYGDICCVEIGCWLSNPSESNLTNIGAILRHLNGLCGRKTLELKEYDLDGLIFWVDIPNGIIKRGSGYSVIGVQFKMEGISQHLDELVYDVLVENIIDIIEDSTLIVLDR